jgi:Transposase DDE domain
MRQGHSTKASTVVSAALCQWVVCQLALSDYKQSVPAVMLARLLLLACATRRSLSFLTQRCDEAPSDETVRKALLGNLPGQDLLLARLVHSLHSPLPRRVRRGRHAAAIDYHCRPFYGDSNTPGVRGGKREAGTNFFWTFATLTLLTPGQRYTLALVPVPKGQTPAQTVELLLGQAERSGVPLRYLLLDKGFYDGETVALLQGKGVRFVVPLVRRGDEEKLSGTTRFFQRGCSTGWYGHGWTAEPRRPDEQTGEVRRLGKIEVRVSVCVLNRGRRSNWVFAAWGIDWPPGMVARRYRARFGIETSYRQLGQVLACTTSKDGRVRLLLVGLALLLRQYACRVEQQQGARWWSEVPRGQRVRLGEVVLWLVLELARLLDFRRDRK